MGRVQTRPPEKINSTMMRNFMDALRPVIGTLSESPKRSLLAEFEDDLFEATNYDEVFGSLKTGIARLAPPEADLDRITSMVDADIEDVVRWAKGTLKKNDRIVWFLRFSKLILAMAFDAAVPGLLKAEMEAYNRKTNGTRIAEQDILPYVAGGGAGLRLRSLLTHFLGSNIAAIDRYTWGWETPDELLARFREFEAEWQETRKGLIDYDPEDGEEIIRFGDGYSWVMLDRAYCKVEGDAMGHCGNVEGRRDTSQRILSLRKLITKGQRKFWEPALTFILHRDGKLGEMKGRANEKPAARYHPYIIKLLLTDLVTGIRGGGYLPQSNFSMDDLGAEERDALIARKPALGGLRYLFNRDGASEEVLAELKAEFRRSGPFSFRPMVTQTHVVLKTYDSLDDIIGALGDRGAKGYLKYLNGDEFIDLGVSPDDGARWMIESFSRTEDKAFNAYLQERYKDAIEAFEDENDADLARDTSEMVRFLEETVPDLYEALWMAYETGQRYGTEAAMHRHLVKAVEGAELSFNMEIQKNGHGFAVTLPIKTAIDIVTDDEFEDLEYEYDRIEIEVDEPRYGFDEFDDQAARESLYDAFPDLKPA